MITLCILVIAIPVTALALQSNRAPETKTNVEEIQKLIENKTEPKIFPHGTYPKPTVAKNSEIQSPQPTGNCLTWMKQAGIQDIQNAYKLILRESECRVNAYNPSGAYGIPQALPGSKMASAGADWRTNPVTQLKWMNNYVIQRYGSWANALNHSYTHSWY